MSKVIQFPKTPPRPTKKVVDDTIYLTGDEDDIEIFYEDEDVVFDLLNVKLDITFDHSLLYPATVPYMERLTQGALNCLLEFDE